MTTPPRTTSTIPDKAKEMLKAAGVENLQTDLWWMPVQRPYNPNAKRMAEMMQADLAKVGINAELKSFEWGEYRKRLQQGEHQMGLLGWTGDNGDPDNFFFLLGCTGAREGGQNISKWCNQEFEDRLQKAKKISDKAERTSLYKEMQVMFKKEAPWVTIAHSTVFEPIRKEVEGYKVSPFGRHEFHGRHQGIAGTSSTAPTIPSPPLWTLPRGEGFVAPARTIFPPPLPARGERTGVRGGLRALPLTFPSLARWAPPSPASRGEVKISGPRRSRRARAG